MSRGKPAGTGAHDEDVGVIVHRFGGIGVQRDDGCESPEARGAADERLIETLPRPARRHERFVIEACRQEARQVVIERAPIEAQRRPAVLALGGQALVQGQRSRQLVRLASARADHIDERAGLLGPCGHDAAGPVVLEAAADQPHAVGEKRRGERVARERFQISRVESKAQRAGRVGERPRGDAAGTRHQRPRSGPPAPAAASTERISCVSV